MPQPRVSIRLGTDGKAQVKQDFAEIGDAGTVQAQRYAAAFQRASADAERALDRQAKAAQRLASAGMVNPITGSAYDTSAKSAAASASIFTKELERQEAEAKRLIASIDPLFAAQMRYADQVARINAVKASGQLEEARYLQLLKAEENELNRATIAAQRHAGTNGQMRMGMQQLGFQLGDIATQYSMGTRASVIFAQQSGQVIQAFQQMGGEGNKVLQFLRGPWGIGLSVAAIALTPLIGKLFESSESIDDMVAKLKKELEQSEKNDRAHEAFANTLDGVREATKKYRDALKGLEDQGKSLAEKTLDGAQAEIARLKVIRQSTIETINATKAQIELNRSRAQVAGMDPRVAGPALADADAQSQRLEALQALLPGLDQTEQQLNTVVETARSFVAVERGSEDAAARIHRTYNALVESTRKRLVAEHATFEEIKKQTEALRDQERAEIEREQKRNRKGPNIERTGGTEISNAQIGAFLDIANRYRGMRETSDKATLESFFRAANENLDPEKTAWCAAFVNAVLAAGGVKGTGSLAARSFLGFGKDDTSSPQKGDIVIVRSGGSPSGMHVGFLNSIDAKGNVSVLGGNTSDRVGTATFAAKDVLGIRRPPSAGEDMAAVDAAAQAAAGAASAEATRQFLETLKATTKDRIAEAAKPLEQRGEALVELDKINEQHEETMTLLKAELGLSGESNDQREETLRLLKLELDLRRQFPGLTQQEIDAIKAQTAAEDALRRQIDATQAMQEEFQRTGEEIVDTIFNPDNWSDWGDMGMKVLREILDLWLQMSLINPLKNQMFGTNLPAFGSQVGGSQLFGFLGNLLGGLGGGGGGAAAAAGSDILVTGTGAASFLGGGGFLGFANGTEYAPGGLAWVGEFGKELVRLPRGSKVTPAGESRRLEAANDAARMVPVGDTYHIGVNLPGGRRGRNGAEDRRTGMQLGGGIHQRLAMGARKGMIGGRAV